MRYESMYWVPPQRRSCHSFFLKTVSSDTPLSKTECSFFMRWVLQTRSMSQALPHFHVHAKESFLRHVPSRQIVPSEIIVVMQLFLPNKPTFVSLLHIAGSTLWLEGWVKFRLCLQMQEYPWNRLSFSQKISCCFLSLYMSLCLLCYVPLKFELLKSLLSYWTFCYLHHGGLLLGKQLIHLLADLFIPACPGCCLPTICFLRWSTVSWHLPCQQYTGSWRSTNIVHKNNTQSPSLLRVYVRVQKELPQESGNLA